MHEIEVIDGEGSRRYKERPDGRWDWQVVVAVGRGLEEVWASGDARSRRECDAQIDDLCPI